MHRWTLWKDVCHRRQHWWWRRRFLYDWSDGGQTQYQISFIEQVRCSDVRVVQHLVLLRVWYVRHFVFRCWLHQLNCRSNRTAHGDAFPVLLKDFAQVHRTLAMVFCSKRVFFVFVFVRTLYVDSKLGAHA